MRVVEGMCAMFTIPMPVDEEDTYEGGRGNVPVAEGPD